MPLGLWKSKWEISREDQTRRDVAWREERIRSDERWIELREECRDLREDYYREIAETRIFNRELLIRLEKAYAGLGEQLKSLHEQVVDNNAAVKAQTQAILKLVDRFEDQNGRHPPEGRT